MLKDSNTVGLNSESESSWSSNREMEDHSQALVRSEVEVLSGEDDAWSEVAKFVVAVQDDSVQVTSVDSPFTEISERWANEVDGQRTEVDEAEGRSGNTTVCSVSSDVLNVWDVVGKRAASLRNAGEFKNADCAW